MKAARFKCAFLWMVLCKSAFGSFQQAKDSISTIQIVGTCDANEVKIRFAPNNALAWKLSNQYGYRISVIEISNDGSEVGAERVLFDSLRPYPIERWKKDINANNTYAPIALQAIHGKKFEITNSGNSVIDARRQTSDRDMRYSFALSACDFSFEVAKASGLGFTLPVKKATSYFITIQSNIPEIIIPISKSSYSIKSDEISELPTLPKLEMIPGEKVMNLEIHLQNNPFGFSGYFIEAAEDNINYRKLHPAPLVKLYNANSDEFIDQIIHYSDTLVANYQFKYYRLKGITAFGEEVISQKTYKACGVDQTPPPPASQVKASIDKSGSVRIDWTYDKIPNDFKGFIVTRNIQPEGTYEPIHDAMLSSSTRMFMDKSPDKSLINYYRVFALDTSGNISQSLYADILLPDTTAPLPPNNIRAIIDTTGIVKITWTKPLEKDISGFRIYKSNQSDHEFTQEKGYLITDTVYYDTLNLKSLTKRIYYSLRSVDFSYNHSEKASIAITKPDMVKPTVPVFQSFEIQDSSIHIAWFRSSSKDVKEERLYRTEPNQKPVLVATLKAGKDMVAHYVDRPIYANQYISYSVEAIDSAGLSSGQARPITLKLPHRKEEISVRNLKVVQDHNKLKLQWNVQGNSHKTTVKRKINNGPFVTLSQTKSNEWIDDAVKSGNTYQYQIIATNMQGFPSNTLTSEILTIK